MATQTTIYFPPELRALWPSPLAARWTEAYPVIFDQDDLRITRRQPKNHFSEWFAAVHLFQRDGVLSLVEKYLYANHPRKMELLRQLFTQKQIETLSSIQTYFNVQPPDLLLFTPQLSPVGFAEVKGPGDAMRPNQLKSHKAITDTLGLQVETILVRPLTVRSSKQAVRTPRTL